ncbi:MAG: methyltransferase domain-containing protein [Calditrichaeota bacterium]|nr:methyltransferase domain-containing protein [Calditrichota bacterium]
MPWNPDTYLKFKNERAEPLIDLLQLVKIRPNLKVIDLGCGTGELTAELAERLPDSNVTGIDNSSEMLNKASPLERPDLRFELINIEEMSGKWDLIFSNAALHWIDDHYSLIPRLLKMLNPGGQLVAQFPSGHRNKAQKAIGEIASTEPFYTAMNNWYWDFPVLKTDEYAELLFMNGGSEITVYDKVYPHILQNADDVFDWVAGTTMIPYIERLPGDLHESFRKKIRERLHQIWREGPLLYPFRRILMAVVAG